MHVPWSTRMRGAHKRVSMDLPCSHHTIPNPCMPSKTPFMALWAPFVSHAGEKHIHPDDALLGIDQARCPTWEETEGAS
jgi:hypothetical protein